MERGEGVGDGTCAGVGKTVMRKEGMKGQWVSGRRKKTENEIGDWEVL